MTHPRMNKNGLEPLQGRPHRHDIRIKQAIADNLRVRVGNKYEPNRLQGLTDKHTTKTSGRHTQNSKKTRIS